MKDSNDKQTVDVFPLPAKRGRPKSATALGNAERQRLHREKRKQSPAFSLGGLSPEELAQVEAFVRDLRKSPSISLTGLYQLVRAEMEISGCSDASIVDLETIWRYGMAGIAPK